MSAAPVASDVTRADERIDAPSRRPAKSEAPGHTQALWIDWGHHLRTQTLARRLGVAVEEIWCDGGRVRRYAWSIRRTIAVIKARRPEVIIATNPSIVLGFLLLLLRRPYGFRLVSDAHYVGVRAVDHAWLLQRLLDFHNSKADLVVVTNESQARFVSSLGSRSYICQDPLPEIPSVPSSVALGDRSVLLICSFDPDEPYEAVFDAFDDLRKEGFTLFVSGNYRKSTIDLSRFPWIRLLGFVPTADYFGYLRSASVVIDLTEMEECLVCGAYEALAAKKPLVVSRTIALEQYFGDAAVMTANTPEAIRESVRWAYAHRDELVQRAGDWVTRNRPYMDDRIDGLRTFLRSPAR